MPLATTCRRCGIEHEPDRAAILAGTWRHCPACRDPDAERPPGACPRCDRWLKSGRHRDGCPGRRRRGLVPPPATDPTGPTRPTNRRRRRGAMTATVDPTDLSALPLDALIAALRPHGATPRASVQALLDRGEIDVRQADRIARRLAGAVGSPMVPLLRKGA